MANVKMGLSKKSTVIILILIFLLVGGGGGYLLWRVNQKETVAPTDSDAGSWIFSPVYDVNYYLLNGSEKKCGACTSNPEKPTGQGCAATGLYRYECGRYCFHDGCGKEACDNIGNLPKFTLKYSADENGKVDNPGPHTVEKGKSGPAVTATPNNATTHEFDKWSDGKTDNPRTDTNVQGNITVNAIFKAKSVPVENFTLQYTVQPAGSGTIQGKATQTVKKGGDGEKVTAVPNSGYKFVGWGGEDGSKTPERQDKNVQKDITAIAMFQKEGVPVEKVNLIYQAGPGGKIEGPDKQTINKGTSGTKVTAKANEGYKFDKWTESPTGKTQAIVSTMIPDNGLQSSRVDTAVQANVTITASFKTACGDGKCDSWENMQNCPADCEGCGDGVCADGETPQTCPQDCPAVCGDGLCTEGESSESCSVDCGAPVTGDSVPETGLFDETENILIMGGILLALGMGWTWISTLPKKAYVTISNTVSEAKSKSVVRERESRRRKLEERIK